MTPRLRASQLINDFAARTAALTAATAALQAEITAKQAALNIAAAPHKAELDALEAEAKALALEHGAEIFGEDKRSLTENGFVLGIRESAGVQVDDEEGAIRMLQKDAAARPRNSSTAMACHACLRVEVTLDKTYILKHYDSAPEWFAGYGIAVADKLSASLKPAPKPRAKKAAKLKTAEAVESEAA